VATEVIMPALGMAQETGRIVRWLKNDGDEVRAGEPLVEVETDKSVVELEAPASGRLTILVPGSDDPVPIGHVIGRIGADGEVTAASPPARPAATPAATAAAAPSGRPAATTAVVERPVPGGPGAPGRVPMSPKARRLARELGVDPERLRAAAAKGPLRAEDVLRLAAASPPPTPSTVVPAENGSLRRYTGVEEAMASRTSQSWRQAPHFYLVRQVDATGLEAWLAAVRRSRPETTFTDLLILAAARVLRRHPHLNAAPAAGGIRVYERVNVGLAVSTERGLVVPVLRAADRMSLGEVTASRRALVEKARSGRLAPQDVSDGTFTISNLGMFGVDQFMPVLNLDQALLMAVGRIVRQPVADGERVVVRPVLTLTLACDHRVTDGASAARFLDDLALALEQPAVLVE
jgi:pyruvate dehydrogenase E2 component (dihydrolipoamide acetyltransferase)